MAHSLAPVNYLHKQLAAIKLQHDNYEALNMMWREDGISIESQTYIDTVAFG